MKNSVPNNVESENIPLIKLNGFDVHPNELIEWSAPVLDISNSKNNYELAQTFSKYINPKWVNLITRLWFSTLTRSSFIFIKPWTKPEDVLNEVWLEKFAVAEDWGNTNINPYTNWLLIKDKNWKWHKKSYFTDIKSKIARGFFRIFGM